MSLSHSSRCCIQLELVDVVKISCGGSPPKEGCLRLNSSITHWLSLPLEECLAD